MDPMMPDLSGLSEEERKILEEVFARQKAEEQKEEKLSAAADKELEDIEKQIRTRTETAQRLVGTQDDAICQICQKTKFADGIGHKCFYCQLRSCARCGGRTTSKNKNIWACSLCQKRQQILAKTGKWFQNPTDQKGSGSQPGSQHDLASQQYPQGQLQTSPSQQPIIMTNGNPNYSMGPNGHASTSGNISGYDSIPNGQPPMMMQQQQPQHQPQQQQQQNHLPSTSQGGGMTNGIMPSQRQIQPSMPQQQQLQQQQQQPVQQQQQPPPPQQQKTAADTVVGGLMGMIGLKSSSNQPPPQQPLQQQQQQKPIPQQQQQQQPFQQQPSQPIAPLNGSVAAPQQPQQHQQIQQQNSQARRQNTLHRQPSLTERDYDRRQSRYDDPPQTSAETSNRRAIEEEKKRRGDPYMDSPRDSIRSTEYDDRGRGNGAPRKISQSQRRGGGDDRSQQIYEDDPSFQKQHRRAPPHVDAQRSPDAQRSSRSSRGDPRNNGGIRRQLSKSGDPQQQQQQSQAQVAAPAYPPAVPPPEKPIGFSTPTTLKPLPSNQSRHRKSKLQSRTSVNKEGTSSEEDASPRGNTESAEKAADFTEKDLLLYIYGAQKAKMGPEMAKFDASLKSKSNLDLATTSRSSILPGNSLAAKIRQYLSSPVSWQPSADQRNLIGHMVLQRLKNDCGDLGLKVAGGRSTANGRLGAFVTKVRPGSVADIVGQLRPGDEVLEWNGHCLQNASLEHVRQIVTSSKNDSQIELIVSRSMSMPGGDDFLNIRRSATGFSDYPDYRLSYENTITIDPTTGMRHSQTHTRPFLSARGVGEISPLAQQQHQHNQQPITYNIPRARNVSAGPSRQKFSVPDMPFSMSQQLISRQHSPLAMQAAINAAGTGQTSISQAQIFGNIEIALLYLPQERELIVNVLGALDLPPRRDGALRNPYAKLFLLPDRSEKSIRQTTVLAETISPQWNESFYYRNLTEPILMSRVLEVTVWDYDKYEANAFLGEVLIDFSTVLLDNQPFSYTLMEMDDENPVRLRLRNRRYSSCTPPPRPYSEMAHYKSSHMRKPPRGGDGYRARIDDDYDTGEYDYGQQQQHIPRSRTYDRAGIGLSATTLAPGMQPQNSCYNCTSGTGATADWNINSSQQGPQGTSNGYISDTYATTQMSSRYYSQRPHSATAIRKDPLLESDGSPLSQQHQQRYRTRPRHRHSQDPSAYRMSPLNSPYGPPDEPQQLRQKQPHSRRYEAPPMDPIAPLPPQHQSQSQQQQQQQSMPLLPPHMQSYSSNNGEYGSDGSETMSVNSAQSMQNRQIIRQQQQQQSHHHQQNQQQQHQLSEDGEGSSNSLRHQRYVNDDYAQNISMEEATQSDTTMKSGAQALKEMKERKKSLMTRLIPGRGAGAGMEKRTGFARSEEVGVPDSLLMPAGGGGNFQKQASKESTDSEKYDWNQATAMNDTAFGTFIEDLGAGQLVGRQVLASPVLGEIELSITLSKFGISVNIMRGKNLTIRANVNNTPAPYVKLYLMEGKVCVCKAKTQPSRKTTAPVFQQAVEFQESFKHRTLQITVLGDCGRMERKLFMGIAQINLDKLSSMPQPVTSWYKLFHNSSLAPGLAPVRKDSENSLLLGGQQQQQQQ